MTVFCTNMGKIKKIFRALSRLESYNLCKDLNVKKKKKMSTGDIDSTSVQGTFYASQQTLDQESCGTDIDCFAPEMHFDVEEKSVSLQSNENHTGSSLSHADKQNRNETDFMVAQAQGDIQQILQPSHEDLDLQAASSETDMDVDCIQIDHSTSKVQTISKGHPSGFPRSLFHTCTDQLTPERISQFLRYYGSKSKHGSFLMSWLCSQLKYLSNDIIRVWVGYETVCETIPVFVAVMKHKDKSINDNFRSICPFKVIQRLPDEVSGEAKSCLKYENANKTSSVEEVRELHDSIAEYAPNLLKSHSNLQIVSSSTIKSRDSGNVTEVRTCIVLYVHVKGIIPLQEKPFPTQMGKFPTDVREGIFSRYAGSKLTLGCEIFSTYGLKGRLGGFVRLSNGKLGCVTCCHIFDTPKSRDDWQHDRFNHNVYQVRPDHDQRPIGSVIKMANKTGGAQEVGVDAALIEVTDRLSAPEDGRFHLSNGAESDDLAEFHSGEILTSKQEIAEIQKSERAKCKIIRHSETNQRYLRSGFMNVSNAFLSWSPATSKEKCQLFSQIEIDPDTDEYTDDQRFAEEGDSGSLVFLATEDNQNIWAIGMVVGGIHPKGSAIVTPIWTILDSFDLPRSLLSFESQRLRKIELYMKETKVAFQTTNQRLTCIEQQTNLTNERLDDIEQQASQYFTQILQRLPSL